MAIPQDANQRWSLDFVSDTLSDGRRFRNLRVIDDFNRDFIKPVKLLIAPVATLAAFKTGICNITNWLQPMVNEPERLAAESARELV